MNKRDRGILYGMVLGDGYLGLLKTQAKDTARLAIVHGPKQLEYLKYKASLLHNIFGGKVPKLYTYKNFNTTTQKFYTNHKLHMNKKYFRQMHRDFYPQGKKVFSRKLLDKLTDQSLAIWYMDDGNGIIHYNKATKKPSGCATRLSTYCSKEEAEVLRTWFIEKYNMNPSFDVDKRNNKYSLRFTTVDSKIFVSIVSPYMFYTMKYKIEHVDKYIPRVRDTLLGEDIV